LFLGSVAPAGKLKIRRVFLRVPAGTTKPKPDAINPSTPLWRGTSSSGMSDLVRITRENGVATLRLHRPEKKNALNVAMYAALGEALHAAEHDDGTRALLLCGAGENFTAGNDLADFAARPSDGGSPAQRFLFGLAQASKPIVAAVDGYAIGVGFTMLLHCDLVYVSDRAKLRAPFVDLGLIPEAASTLLLPQQIGHARAAEVFMLGELLTPQRAEALGIINAVLPAAELETHARNVCERLAKKAPSAMRQTKKLLRDPADTTLERMQREFVIFAEQLQSSDARDAIAAFFAKR
jgi:enoyl-CoA hydratase/carnithine racemase